MALKMQLSERGLAMVMRFEGFRAALYKDEGQQGTIGYGHRILKGECFKDGLTKEKASELLRDDIALVQNAVRKLVRVEIGQPQFDALVSFAYNVGIRAFGNSSLLRELNAGHYAIAATEFLKWNKVHCGGAVLESAGLSARRAAESMMFNERVV